MQPQPAPQQPTYEELLAERDRLLQQQRQLLVERRYVLLAAEALSDTGVSERERALATFVITLLRRSSQTSND